MKRRNTKGLRPFTPGVDARRNIKGQPRKLPGLVELLADIPVEKWGSILNTLIAKAIKGDLRAIEMVLNYAFGKPKESVGHIIELERPQNITGFTIMPPKLLKDGHKEK